MQIEASAFGMEGEGAEGVEYSEDKIVNLLLHHARVTCFNSRVNSTDYTLIIPFYNYIK